MLRARIQSLHVIKHIVTLSYAAKIHIQKTVMRDVLGNPPSLCLTAELNLRRGVAISLDPTR